MIWASDLTLHGALYAGFFPQTLAIGTLLLALLALERRSRASLVAACALALATMLVHPFTGVLLAVVATAEACRLAASRDRAAVRAPIALVVGFLVGSLWPAYSLDRALAETGLRGARLHRPLCARPARVVRSRAARRRAAARRRREGARRAARVDRGGVPACRRRGGRDRAARDLGAAARSVPAG